MHSNVPAQVEISSDQSEFQSSLNIFGLIDAFPLSKQKAIYPIFEAFSNSLHAIEDAIRLKHLGVEAGKITLIIHRDKSQTDHLNGPYPVESVDIADNGIGFTDDNFNSYHDAYSDYKASRGGKGLGHYTYLKVFNEVLVDSKFRDNESGIHRRTFKFIKARPEIIEHLIKDSASNGNIGSKVSLKSIRSEYFGNIPIKLGTIADRIIEHFLLIFMGGLKVDIDIVEADGSDSLDVNRHYEEMYESRQDEDDFDIGDYRFRIQHIRKKKADYGKHMLSFSARGREVTTLALEKHVPVLTKKIRADEGAFYYHGYVSGDYLDSKVNNERTGFNILEDGASNGDDDMLAEPTLTGITKSSVIAAKDHLSSFIQDLETQNTRSTDEYIDRKAPYYKSLKEFAPDRIAEIPADADDREKDLSLYKIKQDIERQAKEGTNDIWREAAADPTYLRNHQEEIEKRLYQINAVKQSDLARYVIQRRTILEILQKFIEIGDDGKPYLERTFHELIFPLGKTSDDVTYEQHNLWLIDERLAFHNYLASDKSLKSNKAVDADDSKEPDVIIFNKPHILAEGTRGPYKQIAILEFKRPLKEQHTADYNPLNQVNELMDRIMKGEVKRNGRKLDIGDPNTVRFFCYIICELSEQIKQTARDMQLTQLPEEEGFLGYNSYRRAFYEVIPFNRLMADAEKRNQAWFYKLGIE